MRNVVMLQRPHYRLMVRVVMNEGIRYHVEVIESTEPLTSLSEKDLERVFHIVDKEDWLESRIETYVQAIVELRTKAAKFHPSKMNANGFFVTIRPRSFDNRLTVQLLHPVAAASS